MKINRLRITGFGPYRETQTVDFDAFDDDGIFLISGKTGAGKSSILDAIAFALYDSVPRYDGTKARLRSDHCAPTDETTVELEFTAGGNRYRVTRSPEYERPKARGTGMTTQKPTAQLDVQRGDTWEGIASRPVDVGTELSEIVGIKKEQFLQVILLAQNRFQQFLLANSRDREAVLRSLFGTRRFADYEEAVAERRRDLEARLQSTRARTEGLIQDAAHLTGAEAPESDAMAWLEQQVLDLGATLATAVSDARAADIVQKDAETRLTEARELHRRQTRLADARQKKTELDAADAEIQRARGDVQVAEAAARVTPYLDAEGTAREAYTRAEERAVAARTVMTRASGDLGSDVLAAEDGSAFDVASADPARLSSIAERLAGVLARLDDSLQQEKRIPALDEEADRAARQAAAVADRRDALAGRLAELPTLITAATDELTAARVAASGEDAARADVERLERARNAAENVVRLDTELEVAQQREVEAVRANTEASRKLQHLLDARLAGHAAELAVELVEGEPCAVCGATQHPSPAVHDAERITEDDIEAARDELTRCEDAKAAAARTVTSLQTERAEQNAIARAGVTEIDAELGPVREKLAAAVTAAGTVTELEQKVGELGTERENADAERETLNAQHDEHARAEKDARAEIERIRAQTASQRGDFATIADAVHAHSAAKVAASELATAQRALHDRGDGLRAAEAQREQALTEHGFDDVAAAREAMRDAASLDALRQSIRAHDDARAAVAATLSDPELADLPDAVPDLDASEEALAVARDARDEANRRRDTLQERHTSLVRTVTTVKRESEASAELNREYEVVRGLAETLAGAGPNTRKMRLESYVLAAELERIVDAANARLRTMTGGRYALEHDDSVQYRNVKSGLGLSIFDQHTGQSRATHSLSGGETFLASLALALGLAEVVTARAGGITLDTLFIDEGFGSLDGDTLEVAMSTLDSLRAGGRTVGLISHVEGMKEQIPAKLRITVADGGWSEIHQGA